MRTFASVAPRSPAPQNERGPDSGAKSATQDSERQPTPRLDWSFSNITPGPFLPRISFSSLSRPTIQCKLVVNQPGDRYEQEADRIAEQVMRMPDPGTSPPNASSAAAPLVQRKCSKCQEEEKLQRKCDKCEEEEKLQRKCDKCEEEEKLHRKSEDGPSSPAAAPPIVHEVLNSPGHPLDSATRAFFEPRLGYDFSRVRVHHDAKATESAASVNARAYTVGKNIIFGEGHYSPARADGKQLLAHELTHVMQQEGAPPIALQRACRSAAQCAIPTSGSAGQFGPKVEAESEAIAVASGGVAPIGGGPTSCALPRHKERAINFETLALTAGLGATIDPQIAGFFINACLSPNDGGSTGKCSDFPGGPPLGAPPGKFCVQLHTFDEDDAKALLAKPKPLGSTDLERFLWITATVLHESQHKRFDAKVDAGTVAFSATECDSSTPVPTANNRNVESLLSEISAEIGEFDVYFRNTKVNPGRPSTWALQTEEHNVASRGVKGAPPGTPVETILGNIKDIQCVCNCGTTAQFVKDVFLEASGSWTDEERKEFKKAMTDFIPSFWPTSLHQK